MDIGGLSFSHIRNIAPDRAPDGEIARHMPQPRYLNRRCLARLRYGNGPFCRPPHVALAIWI
ncbi:hypothetical protein BO1005MUT1_180144 [Hyphomicrobiales bacterium]|nr:hypothetical protein BO1005MUT1_180144 [Hyphomicrobiales bacterium]